MERIKNDISLIIINAVHTLPDDLLEKKDYPMIEVPNMQDLINSGIASNIHEHYRTLSRLKHNGSRKYIQSERVIEYHEDDETPKRIIQLPPEKVYVINYQIRGTVVLVGGPFGNKGKDHYEFSISLLEQMKKDGESIHIHIPLDLSYKIDWLYWQEDGILYHWSRGSALDDKDLKYYTKSFQQFYPRSRIITEKKAFNTSRQISLFGVKSPKETTLTFWEKWENMVKYLHSEGSS